MTENSSRKLNIGPLPEQVDDYSHYEETELNWGRILIVIVIIAGVLFGVYSLFSSSDEVEISQQSSVQSKVPTANQKKEATANQKKESAAIQEDMPAADQAKALVASNDKVPAADKAEAIQNSESTRARITLPKEKDVKAETVPAVVQQTKPDLEEKIEPQEAPDSKATSDRESKSDLASARDNQPQEVNESSNVTETRNVSQPKTDPVSILHKGIAHAQLSSTLKEGRPVDELASLVEMSEEGIIKVVLYTEMKNIKGTWLRHVWYRNDIKQATVKVPVNYDSQRSSSSKFINAQMLGDWRVEVLNEKQQLYAQAEFKVVAYK